MKISPALAQVVRRTGSHFCITMHFTSHYSCFLRPAARGKYGYRHGGAIGLVFWCTLRSLLQSIIVSSFFLFLLASVLFFLLLIPKDVQSHSYCSIPASSATLYRHWLKLASSTHLSHIIKNIQTFTNTRLQPVSALDSRHRHHSLD